MENNFIVPSMSENVNSIRKIKNAAWIERETQSGVFQLHVEIYFESQLHYFQVYRHVLFRDRLVSPLEIEVNFRSTL